MTDGWRDVRREIDEELRFHIEERVEALVASGMSEARARAEALAEFGDVDAVRDGLERIDSRMAKRRGRRERLLVVWQEWRQSVRRLGRSPGFVAAVVLTLGTGIGAATAVFSLLDSVVLRALPYAEPERLVRLRNDVPGIGPSPWGWAQGQFLYVESRVRSFDRMGLYRFRSATLMEPGAQSAEYGTVASVSAGLADVLGAGIAMGRRLRPDENLAGAAPVVVVTHSYWSRRLDSDPGVIGKMVDVNGEPHEVVGVLSRDAQLPEEVESAPSFGVDAWVPLRLDPADPPRNNHVYQAVARLAPGVDAAVAMSELERLTGRFSADMPSAYTEGFMEESGFTPLVLPLHEEVVGGTARVLWILFGAVGLVLAITCANVANLLLVRLETRRREIAIRSVLGASRGNVIRQLLVESVTLTGLAGFAGLLVAVAGVALIRNASPSGLPRIAELGMGTNAALFALGVSLLIGVIFGVLPGLRRSRGHDVLAETGRGSTVTRRRLIVRHTLIGVQIGLSFVLLSGAGLLLRSFQSLSRIDPGFEPDGVLVFRVVLPAEAYPDYAATGALYRQASERLAALPSVERVGMTASLPLGGDTGCTGLQVDNPDADGACVRVTYATPGYFAAAGIPVRGRDMTWAEVSAGGRVAVISEALARRLFPGLDPIGRRIRASTIPDGWHTIVGVAGDVSEGGLDDPASELAYLPVMPDQPALGPARGMAVLLRTGLAEPTTLLPAVRGALADIDPRVPITRPGTMDDIVRRSLSRLTFMSTLLLAAALMAVLVGGVGIYGVVSYAVAQRRGEIGIRMALGARAAQVRRLILGQSVGVAAAGIAAGLLLAIPLAGALRAYLFGVSVADPLTLGAVAAVLLLLAGLAGHLPARRALAIDPVEALRPD